MVADLSHHRPRESRRYDWLVRVDLHLQGVWGGVAFVFFVFFLFFLLLLLLNVLRE